MVNDVLSVFRAVIEEEDFSLSRIRSITLNNWIGSLAARLTVLLLCQLGWALKCIINSLIDHKSQILLKRDLGL